MRNLLITSMLFSVLLCSVTAKATELQTAYQKEYAFLVAEKKALQDRVALLTKNNASDLKSAESEIASLQQQFIAKSNKIDRHNRLIADASRDVDFNDSDALLLETTVLQSKETLLKNDIKIDDVITNDQALTAAFTQAVDLLSKDGVVTIDNSAEFFAAGGELVKGAVVRLGRIAQYGVSPSGSGVLAPAGEGRFRVWDGTTAKTAELLVNKQQPTQVDLLLYENPLSAMEKQDDKTLGDDIVAGGLIGKIILFIGLVGVALLIVRLSALLKFSSNLQQMTAGVNNAMREKGVKGALALCKEKGDSASRVIASTLKNLNKERDHIEDIISESILHESSKIDRFGSIILVIAAVSPLLGLLGTVTGMISTFDIITEFGTGDPKLLSTGISEALITTKFGLVVAIPMLLLGNTLSSWATRTKNDLECAALHIINTYKTAS